MRIDWWTLGLQTVNLLVLLWLLGRYLFRPMAAIVAQRQAEADKLLDAAKVAAARADEAEKAADAARASTQAESAAAIEAAHRDADAQRAALIEAARQDAQHKLDEAAAEIARMRSDDEARNSRRATALAGDIAGKLLEGPAAQLPTVAFLEELTKAIAALPETAREGIGAHGDKPILVVARPLGEADLAACHAAIGKALGRDVTLQTATDPQIIAGLRLTSANVEVDANLRHHLAQVQSELDAHDG